MIAWILLIRFLRLDWRINTRWLFVLGLSWDFWLVFCHLYWVRDVGGETARTTKTVFVWMPLLTMVYEIGTQHLLKRCFMEFQNNDVGIMWATLNMLCIPEFIRFVSFILVYLDGSPRDLIFNFLFSLIGEIWTHTQIGPLCQYEFKIRLWGSRADRFPDLQKVICSALSHMEYVAPFFFFSGLYCEHAIWGLHSHLNPLWKKKWLILGTYLLQEFIAEVVCRAIRKRSGYTRLSTVGHIKMNVQIMTVVCFILLYSMYLDLTYFVLLLA